MVSEGRRCAGESVVLYLKTSSPGSKQQHHRTLWAIASRLSVRNTVLSAATLELILDWAPVIADVRLNVSIGIYATRNHDLGRSGNELGQAFHT